MEYKPKMGDNCAWCKPICLEHEMTRTCTNDQCINCLSAPLFSVVPS